MESIKYFKFELDTPSREALKLINKKGYWKPNYFGKSKYYYSNIGTCLKDSSKLISSDIISAKEMIKLLSPKKEVDIHLEMTPICKGESLGTEKFNEMILRNYFKNKNIQSVVVKCVDPIYLEFKKILTSFNSLEEQFNLAKELFNK